MTQLITNIGIPFPDGVSVADIVLAMVRDNWDKPGFNPVKAKVRFTDTGYQGNFNYQIAFKQRPYRIIRSSGSGKYQHIEAEVEINVYQRMISMKKPVYLDNMMHRVSDIIQTNNKDLQTGIVDPTMATLASGMDSIRMTTEFDEPGVDTLTMQLKPAGASSAWHTQAFATVWFFRYIA